MPDPAAPNHTVDATPISDRLRDGTPIVMRPLLPEDAQLLLRGFDKLSSRTRYTRFLQAVDRLTPDQVDYLTHVDGYDHLAWGATAVDPATGETVGIAIARSVREPLHAEEAEFAIVVADEWQHRGVGSRLTRVLAEKARQAGVARWRATMLATNAPVLRLMALAGSEISRSTDGRGCLEVVYQLAEPSPK